MVISFIVEAFVLQLEQENHRKEREQLQKKKLLGRDFQIVYDTDCVEGSYPLLASHRCTRNPPYFVRPFRNHCQRAGANPYRNLAHALWCF